MYLMSRQNGKEICQHLTKFKKQETQIKKNNQERGLHKNLQRLSKDELHIE